jgi:energy-coupling factor transport system permease protein
MQLLEPLVPDPRAWLARANPVAKLGAAVVLMVAAFVAVDIVTPAILVTVLMTALPGAGLRAGALAGRLWPLGVAAVGVGLLNALLADDPTGTLLWQLGLLVLTTGSLIDGVALALRLLAIALAGVLSFVATDPTELTDALVQQLHVSPRLAVGGLAGARALPILAEEWQAIGLARRARGVDAGRSPTAAARLFGGRMLALLVRAVRRGVRMAAAMEARGFGTADCRTVARAQRMHGRDWALLIGAALVAVAATAFSMSIGSWRFIFG